MQNHIACSKLIPATLIAAAFTAAAFTLFAAVPIGAQLVLDDVLIASDPLGQHEFGAAVDTDGVRVVVGATQDNASAGAAYVYRQDSGAWIFEQKLVANDAAAGAQFGSAVAVSRDVIVVGARFDSENGNSAGAAYVFRESGGVWTEEDKLLASNGAALHRFGNAVDVGHAVPRDSPSGEEVLDVVVGAPIADSSEGIVYLFELSPDTSVWNEIGRLQDDDVNFRSQLGTSVAISGDRIVAGASDHDTLTGSDTGAAYVFRRQGVINTWSQENRLEPPVLESQSRFGETVAMDGGRIIIGAPLEDRGGIDRGAAYTVEGIGPGLTVVPLLPANPADRDQFGRAVAVLRSLALVGSRDTVRGSAGAVHIFEAVGTTWTEIQTVIDASGMANDEFGNALALGGTFAAIGVHDADVPDPMTAQTLFDEGMVVLFNTPLIFADGFESGNTSAWTTSP